MSGGESPRPSRAATTWWPLGTIALVAALYVAFRVDYATRAHRGIGLEPLPERWVFDGADPKPWQFITYAFVHAFAWHLRINVIALSPSALLLERRVGWWRTIVSFVLLAAMVSVGFHLIDERDLYGASGVVAGFATMAATQWARARDQRGWKRAIPAVLAAAYLGATELWPALHGTPNPGWKPHLVGALSGVVLGLSARAASGSARPSMPGSSG